MAKESNIPVTCQRDGIRISMHHASLVGSSKSYNGMRLKANRERPGISTIGSPCISSLCFFSFSLLRRAATSDKKMLYSQNIASLGAFLLLAQTSTTLAHPARHTHHHKHHTVRNIAAKHQIGVPADTSEILWSDHTAQTSLRKRGSQEDGSNGRKEEEGKTFTIRQVKNPRLEKRSTAQHNGLSALLHAYAKYGVEPSPRIKRAMKLNPAFREYREELEKSMTTTLFHSTQK